MTFHTIYAFEIHAEVITRVAGCSKAKVLTSCPQSVTCQNKLSENLTNLFITLVYTHSEQNDKSYMLTKYLNYQSKISTSVQEQVGELVLADRGVCIKVA